MRRPGRRFKHKSERPGAGILRNARICVTIGGSGERHADGEDVYYSRAYHTRDSHLSWSDEPVGTGGSGRYVTPLRFEAASLKLAADQDVLQTRPKRTIGRFRWKTQLWYLLGYACQMEFWRIAQKPESGSVSLNSIYELEATTTPDTTEQQVGLMLQTLLVERFGMVAHRETKRDHRCGKGDSTTNVLRRVAGNSCVISEESPAEQGFDIFKSS